MVPVKSTGCGKVNYVGSEFIRAGKHNDKALQSKHLYNKNATTVI